MHQENKLTNHGKQVISSAQSQVPNVNQQQQLGPACNLGSKGVGLGNHGAKANQISSGNLGLKSPGQSSSGVGVPLKGKTKRERSVSMDSGELRDALGPALEPDAKEGVMRSKRRCVLEKKQPYSGDEWCSGGDTEEEEEKPSAAPHRPGQSLPGPSPMGAISESAVPVGGRSIGPSLRAELASLPRPPQQVVYVFTTSLANRAAEAVIHGHADSILLFHQQNVPRTKLDQCVSSGKLPSLTEQLSSGSTPPTVIPKSQSGTPRPASVGGSTGVHLHPPGTPSSPGHPEDEAHQARPGGAPNSNCGSIPGPHPSAANPSAVGGRNGGPDGPGLLPQAGSPSPSPGAASVHLLGEAVVREGSAGAEGLSQEQLEHRERSLQTLRDIERLLLRGTAGGGPGDCGGPNDGNPIGNNNGGSSLDSNGRSNNPGNCNNNNLTLAPPAGGLKKYEEPLQSMISQTASLGGPGLDDPHMSPHPGLPPMHNHPHPHPHHHHHHHHPHLSSPSSLDMGPLLGSEGLTPEQVAWRKLQEEYYQEKRRQQEMHPHHHHRMMADMGMGVMRAPPPPYHSKPGEPQWGPGPMIGGGGNGRLIDMHQEGPRGPRFLGQMQRGPPGGAARGYPGNPGGGMLPMEAMIHQRPPRSGMGWPDDLIPPNMGGGGGGGGGLFQGCYPPGEHLQGDHERLLPPQRQEFFRALEKRQLQGLHRMELDRLAKQQGAFGGGPPPSRGDPMDFPSSRGMMGSPMGGSGPPGRELVDMNMNANMNLGLHMGSQQQQQMMLGQKAREAGPEGGEVLLSPEEISRVRAAQNGGGGGGVGMLGNKTMISGGGSLPFPTQASFPGGHPGGGGYLPQEPGPDMFRPDQQGLSPLGGTPRLSHMPMNSGQRSADLGPRCSSELSLNINQMGSPALPPPHQHKSPSLSQAPSPLMPSPSAPSLKSPQVPSAGPPPPPLPPATSGAGTPSSSIKSPQVMGAPSLGLHSPSASPGRLKSPAMPIASPGWAASPKTAQPSPVGPAGIKGVGNGGNSSTDTGPSLPPRSTNSTPISQPGSMNPSMPFTSSPDAPPSQNPLSLIMSQMSKYAMPSSTPLYHDAIKTIATSDDEMMPDRPMMPGANMAGNMGNNPSSQMLLTPQNSMGPHSGSHSPMGMVLHGQPQLSHDPSGPMLHSPSPMGMPGMNPAMMGGGAGGGPDGIGPCNISPMLPQNQMGTFPRMQPPPHALLHSPNPGMPQQFHPPPEEVGIPHHQLQLLSKGLPHQRGLHPQDPFSPMSMGDGPDLSDVIRPTPTGIPEFDLSRIIPSDKPSSTLQYFPKSEPMSQPGPNPNPSQHPPPHHLKQHPSSGPPNSSAPSSNPHLTSLQNMMAEQQLPPPQHPAHLEMRSGLGGPRGMGPGGGMGPMCHPGHMMSRTGMMSHNSLQQQQQHLHQQQQQQAMMANSLLHHPSHPHPHPHPHPAMMSPQQNLMSQQGLMMMQAKQRGINVHGDPYGQQGPMMGPPHPQSGMLGPQTSRQRGMPLEGPVRYGPGNMANMPF